VSSADHLIVYVDDERANRIVFEQSFGKRFNVRTLASAKDALELLRQESVAVLITDQRMPEMTGHELLTRVKQQYPDIVRVVITAYGDLDAILAAVNQGLVFRYIVKPWDRAELEEILHWSLEAFALGRQESALQLRLMQTERLVTLGLMVGAVLHDLHNPIASLTVNVERLDELSQRRDKAGQKALAEELPELARDLLTSCHVMRDLTVQLKQFVRNEAREAEPAAVVTDPIPIVRYAISVCRETAVRARGRISYEGPAKLPRLRIGSTELTQILINVVANAAQALLARDKPGGRVAVSASDAGTMVQLSVEDTGVGMSEAALKRVGTPFYSTRPDGTGLGVAQCRRLVEGAGGSFRIESTEGQGTTVAFSIPKA
jgi:signal transduction histidine kinase